MISLLAIKLDHHVLVSISLPITQELRMTNEATTVVSYLVPVNSEDCAFLHGFFHPRQNLISESRYTIVLVGVIFFAGATACHDSEHNVADLLLLLG
ncbi:hypothetical protein GmHk_03G006422 [Glycine max]|nr:hypothetical protein GmHk_03G006422 [Glycine max]